MEIYSVHLGQDFPVISVDFSPDLVVLKQLNQTKLRYYGESFFAVHLLHSELTTRLIITLVIYLLVQLSIILEINVLLSFYDPL